MAEFKPVQIPKIKKDTLKNISMSIVILLIVAVYSLFDLVSLEFKLELILSPEYWALLALNTFLIVLFMTSVRQIRKDHKLSKPDRVKENGQIISKANQFEVYMNNLNIGYNKITKEGLSNKLEAYLLELNKDKKYRLYQQAVLHKIYKLKDKIKIEQEHKTNKRTVKILAKIKDLEQKLTLSKEDTWKIKFKFNSVTISKLFSSVNGKTIDDDETNINIEEGKDISRMIFTKILFVIAFSAFTGSLIPSFLSGIGWMIIVTIILKLITLIMSANMSISSADNFVDTNIRISLQRRIRILADFNNINNLGKLDIVEKQYEERIQELSTIETKKTDAKLEVKTETKVLDTKTEILEENTTEETKIETI